MLQKALVLVFVVASIASCISCGKTSSHYVYATIPAADQVKAYREDPNSGVLTEIQGSPYPVGDGAHSAVLHPSGKFLYVANPGSTGKRYFPVHYRHRRSFDRSDSADPDWSQWLAAGIPGHGSRRQLPVRGEHLVLSTSRSFRSIAAPARSPSFPILRFRFACHR